MTSLKQLVWWAAARQDAFVYADRGTHEVLAVEHRSKAADADGGIADSA